MLQCMLAAVSIQSAQTSHNLQTTVSECSHHMYLRGRQIHTQSMQTPCILQTVTAVCQISGMMLLPDEAASKASHTALRCNGHCRATHALASSQLNQQTITKITPPSHCIAI